MPDEVIDFLLKLLELPTKDITQSHVLFTLAISLTANIVFFYTLLDRINVFGRDSSTNSILNLILAGVVSFFTIKLGFLAYIVAVIGISFLYIKNDVLKLVVSLLLIVLYFVGLYYLK